MKANRLMLFKQTVAVCCENYSEYVMQSVTKGRASQHCNGLVRLDTTLALSSLDCSLVEGNLLPVR
jgi:hypothetical protein